MPVFVLTGGMGSGKTTVCTAMGVLSHELDDVKIFANYRLANIDYTYFSPTDFVDLLEGEELFNATVLLDEAYLMMDSRNSPSRMNRLFSAFVYQARKRDVDVFIVSHNQDHIDLRVRRAMAFRWRPRYNPSTKTIVVYSRNLETGHRSRFKLFAPKFWPYFDTNEIPATPKKLRRLEF